jgi:SAM-dependent methyltransferase
VADLGCGSGWSTIAIALGFPNTEIVGVDLDQGSIEDARANAEQAGVADRVTFRVASAADPGLPRESYDLVCAFETIHDMSDPVGALTAMREMRALEGTVLVADERVADTFTTEVDTAERFHWGWSVLQCLPSSLASPPAAGTGTVMRTPTLRAYAEQAGFADIEILPVKHDFWRFYRLVG